MSYIRRNIDKDIQQWYESDKRALMIFGARQIGKTESVKEFLRQLYSIEDDSYLPMLDIENMPGVKEAIISGQSEGGPSFIRNLFANAEIMADLDQCKVILIDEIQALSSSKKLKAEGEIKDILTRLMAETEFRFIFSGSLLGAKISNLEDFTKNLPGGVIHLHMYPISFPEFVEHLDGNRDNLDAARRCILNSETLDEETHVHLLKRYGEYSFVGGMPKAELAYFHDNKFSPKDSLEAISTLKDDYIQDTQKYYREELGIEVGNNVFEWILFGIGDNNKKKMMKAFKKDPEKTLYQFIIDSDIGLLVSHIDEFDLPLEKQQNPKTYLNDVGFMRLMIEEQMKRAKDYDSLPYQLRGYYSRDKDLDEIKNDYLDYIENKGGCTFPGAGWIFEQLTAQGIKERSYIFAYAKQDNPPMELEFLLPKDESAIEVKSGGFADYPSSKNYAEEKKKRVYFVSLLPYVGKSTENFIVLPIYSLSLLTQEELMSIAFKQAEPIVHEILESGLLPKARGFYGGKTDS